MGAVLGAIATVVVGAAVIGGPFVSRLTTELAEERRSRIRTTERAEMSAHLHDSVLQTLALIQRHADDPRLTAHLARRQERELRAWLLGVADDPARTLRTAIAAAIETVENDHAIRVELVHTGDAEVELDEPAEAIVGAIREAVVNASKHAGVADVSVFVEVTPTAVNAFIRDRGCGFDPAAVPADRRGLADSIVGRLQRNGGSAQVDSHIGLGTEVALSLPRQAGVGR